MVLRFRFQEQSRRFFFLSTGPVTKGSALWRLRLTSHVANMGWLPWLRVRICDKVGQFNGGSEHYWSEASLRLTFNLN